VENACIVKLTRMFCRWKQVAGGMGCRLEAAEVFHDGCRHQSAEAEIPADMGSTFSLFTVKLSLGTKRMNIRYCITVSGTHQHRLCWKKRVK